MNWFAALLTTWEGRHRYADLSAALVDDASPEAILRALLADLGSDRGPRETAETLIDRGHLRAARRVLSECDLGVDADLLDERLEEAERRGRDNARARTKRLQARAARLGLTADLDAASAAIEAQHDPRTVTKLLDDAEELLSISRDEAADALRSEARARAEYLHPEQREQWLVEIEAAIQQDALLEVRAILDGHNDERPPWFVPTPSLSGLPDDDDLAMDVIEGADGGTAAPAIRRLYARPDLAKVVQAYRGIDGTLESAQLCADVVIDLLRGTPTRVAADPSGEGHVVPLHALSRSAPATQVGLPPVRLWIARPDAVELAGGGDGQLTLAIGDALERDAGRNHVALLGWRDLVRVALTKQQPELVLLRIAAVQWPLEAIIDDDAHGLEQRLTGATTDRRTGIAWMVHLAGLGGMIQSGAVVQATGGRPALIRRVLHKLADPRVDAVGSTQRSLLSGKVTPDDIFAGMPRVGPSERAAFWATLENGRFGEPVPREDLAILAQLHAAADTTEDQRRAIADRVLVGLDHLAEHGLLEGDGIEGTVRLERWDYVEPLLMNTDRRLEDAVVRVIASAERATASIESRFLPVIEWLRTHREQSTKPTDSANDYVTGGFDVRGVLVQLRDTYQDQDPNFQVDILGEECPQVDLPQELFWLVIDELLRNAAECNDWECRVTIEPAFDDETVEILVVDNGVGVGQLGRKLFKPGESGRNSSGNGLYFVRQGLEAAGGGIDHVSSGESGAEFQLWIPRKNR